LDRLVLALEQFGTPADILHPMPEALSIEEAARFIGVDVTTIQYLIRVKKLEYVQYGSQRGRIIPVESLRRFLQEYRQATGKEQRRKRGRK
jgi:excisionase family DNA binding protein